MSFSFKIKLISCENNDSSTAADIARLVYADSLGEISDSSESPFKISCFKNSEDSTKVKLIFTSAYPTKEDLFTFDADKLKEYKILIS